MNTTALLHLARETLPAMIDAGKGAILITGNTSATRGKTNWGFFASTKAAQRILAESIAREFGPKGIHTAYFIMTPPLTHLGRDQCSLQINQMSFLLNHPQ